MGPGATHLGYRRGAVDAAFAAGEILRTHLLRPTWHFVTPADIRGLLALTGPRVHARRPRRCTGGWASTPTTMRRVEPAVQAGVDGRAVSRPAVQQAIADAGVDMSVPMRMSHLLMHLELDGMICSGPRIGNQFSYRLLDDIVGVPDRISMSGGRGRSGAAVRAQPRPGDRARHGHLVGAHRHRLPGGAGRQPAGAGRADRRRGDYWDAAEPAAERAAPARARCCPSTTSTSPATGTGSRASTRPTSSGCADGQRPHRGGHAGHPAGRHLETADHRRRSGGGGQRRSTTWPTTSWPRSTRRAAGSRTTPATPSSTADHPDQGSLRREHRADLDVHPAADGEPRGPHAEGLAVEHAADRTCSRPSVSCSPTRDLHLDLAGRSACADGGRRGPAAGCACARPDRDGECRVRTEVEQTAFGQVAFATRRFRCRSRPGRARQSHREARRQDRSRPGRAERDNAGDVHPQLVRGERRGALSGVESSTPRC